MIKQLFQAGVAASVLPQVSTTRSAIPPTTAGATGLAARAPEWMFREISANLRRIYGVSISPLVNPDTLVRRKGLYIYQEMMQDDQIKAAVTFKKHAILTTGWHVVPAEKAVESGGAATQEIADFVAYSIETMDGSFGDDLLDILSALQFGFCLHGDTVVHSPEGDRPIKNWVGRQPWVYSWVDGALRLAKAKRVWRSQQNVPCVKVTYDWWAGAGQRKTESIICTDTHPFMLLDGTFRKAGELTAGDRLAPFNHTVKSPGGARRAFVKTGRTSMTWQKRAWWVWEQMHGPRPASGVIYHVDNDPMNDAPENLAWMPRKGVGAHSGFHMREWLRSATPEQLAARSAAISAANDAELLVLTSAASRKANLRNWRNPAVRARRVTGMRGKARSEESRQRIADAARQPERRGKVARGVRLSWAPERRAAQAARTRQQNYARRASEENHRVLSVEPWGVTDVYDMEVPGAHNFAANGVFVHNSVTEKVYRRITERCPYTDKIGLRSLKTRMPYTFGFDVDPFDNLNENGVVQWGRKYPKDKFIVYSFQHEFDNFFGTSDLRAAYRAWWFKDNVIKWWAMFMDRYSIPLAVGTFGQDVVPGAQGTMQTILDHLQASTSITMPANWKLEFPTIGTAQGAQVFNLAIEAADLRIARAILLPNQLGFSAQPAVGTYAQARKQFDAFLMVVEKIRNDLEELLHEHLVRPLVALNYDVAVVPRFRFRPFTEQDRQGMMTQFFQAIAAGVARPRAADEVHVRELVEFPEVPEEVLAAEAEQAAKQPPSGVSVGIPGVQGEQRLREALGGGGILPGEHPLTDRAAEALAGRGAQVYSAAGQTSNERLQRRDVSDILHGLEAQHPDWTDEQLVQAAVDELAGGRLGSDGDGQSGFRQDGGQQSDGLSDEELQSILDEVLGDAGAAPDTLEAAADEALIQQVQSEHPDWTADEVKAEVDRQAGEE